jgi:hypothetical protein
MVAIIVLTAGLASFAPFVWRALRLKERSAGLLAAVVTGGEVTWLTLSQSTLTGPIGGLIGILTIAGAILSALWVFRPLTKAEYWGE